MASITLRWIEKTMMAVTDSHGHSIVVGHSPDTQFDWVGVKPSDLLLMAVASCAAYDVVEILTKQREPLCDLRVICTGGQMKDPPWQFTKVHLEYIIQGDVRADRLERAIQLSEDKYCSVINSLKPTVEFSHSFKIAPDASGAVTELKE